MTIELDGSFNAEVLRGVAHTISDTMAFGAMQTAREFGLFIPAELSIVGFDNNVEATSFSRGPCYPAYRCGNICSHCVGAVGNDGVRGLQAKFTKEGRSLAQQAMVH